MAINNEETSIAWLRSLDKETDQPVQGVLTGTIPGWLQGKLIRNGSGVYELGQSRMQSLFDGMSVLHQFSIRDGKATYQNRILKSRTYLEGVKADRLTMTQYGTFAHPDPCKSLLGRYMSRFEPMRKGKMTDNCNVSVCYIGDKLYALTESTLIREIDEKSLETIGKKLNVMDFVAVNHWTAHPHVAEDGTVFNLGTSYGIKGASYNVVRFPPGGSSFKKAKVVASFPVRWKMSSSYYHSFGLTENYFVFIESPMILNISKFMTMNWREEPMSSAMKWCSNERPRIFLADRKTGKLVKQVYEAPAFMAFHHGNAYEKDGYLIMDVVAHPNANIMNEWNVEHIRKDKDHTYGRYTRYILPLNVQVPHKMSSRNGTTHLEEPANLIQLDGFKGKAHWMNRTTIMCEPERLMDRTFELPRINYHLNGKFYRYVYGITHRLGSAETEKVLKLNVETKEVKEWFREGYTVSEPVFVARPGSKEEDDGCILFSALDLKDTKKVLLGVLNASTFEEEAIVEFKASGIVPKDFHGMFSRDDEKVQTF